MRRILSDSGRVKSMDQASTSFNFARPKLKETKEAGLFLVKIAIAEIINGNDSSDHLSSFFKEEKARFRVISKKSVVSFVEKFFLT